MSAQHEDEQEPAAALAEDQAGPGPHRPRSPHPGPPKPPIRRPALAVAGAVVGVVALVAGVTAVSRNLSAEDRPQGTQAATPHLPTVVNAPGTWSDDEDPEGPLAAVGLALRTRPEGLTGERQHLELFGVSAVDGRSAWIELPGVDVEDRSLIGWFALSPDGRWLAWERQRARRHPRPALALTAPLAGWAVMDTTTGETRRFSDRAHPRIRNTLNDLALSDDSRYLLTTYETADAPTTRGHRFVAWDIDGGTPTVLEEPGHYWLPNVGSAPTGVVWSRGRQVYREDAATGRRSSYSLPRWVSTASWGPDDTAFAYIGQRPAAEGAPEWRLYAGRSLAEARDRALDLDVGPDELLGWRDDRHVVVGHSRSTVHVVDVVTGDAEEVDMTGHGEVVNSPLLATALWRNPLVTPVEPTGTTDPRAPFRWGGGVLLVLLAAAWVLRRRWWISRS